MTRGGALSGWLTDGYGRWVIDLDRGWPTERLDLEPLAVAHAAELAPLLDDACLHEFIGGAPLSAAALAARYEYLVAHRSPEGDQSWGNWVVRVRTTGVAAGVVQATLPAGGPAAGPAEVAWVVVRASQGRGYAKEAARSLVAVLQEAGWTVVAISIPATWPPSVSPAPPGCHRPPRSVTARCTGPARRLRRLNPRQLRPHRHPPLPRGDSGRHDVAVGPGDRL